jgi:hypothetical protein
MLQKIFCLFVIAGMLFAACKKNNTGTDPAPVPTNNDPYIPPKWDRKDLLDAGNFCDIQMMNKKLAYAADSKGQFWRTVDSGNNWARTVIISPVEIIGAIHFISDAKGFAITDTRILKTTDSGSTWQMLAFISGGHDIFFTDEQTGFYSSSSAVFKTTNGGVTWVFSRTAENGKLVFVSAANGWVNDKNARLYATANGGTNWTLLNSAAAGGQSPFYYGLHAWNAQHVAAGKVNALRITQTGSTPLTNIVDTAHPGAITSVHYTGPGKGFLISNKHFISRFNLPDTLVRGETILSAGGFNEMSFTDSTTGMICGNNGLILRLRK